MSSLSPSASPVAPTASPPGVPRIQVGRQLYANALASPADVADFVVEGTALLSFPRGRLRLETSAARDAGQAGNYVLWCRRQFPDNIEISFDFWPIYEPALCMMFFAAQGRKGEDLFDPGLAPRSGQYAQYHSGDINTLHVSWWRRGRKFMETEPLHTCNLRKSAGFHLVAQGPDPLPAARDAVGPYRIRIAKLGPHVLFYVGSLLCLHWLDGGQTYGPVLGPGKIGLRQMVPTIAEYAHLEVREINS